MLSLHSFISEMVDDALKEEKDTANIDPVEAVFMSILKASGLELKDKKAAVIDFIAAGIQTVSRL